MKINKIFTCCLIAGALALGSCQKDYEVEQITNNEMSGQWLVQTYRNAIHPDSLWDVYREIVTSNTSKADGTELLIDDKGNVWYSHFIVKANVSGLGFSVENAPNLSEDSITVSIRNGAVIPDGGRAIVSRTVVDSIYFEAEFSNTPAAEGPPGTFYIITGHYRTGFEEDEP